MKYLNGFTLVELMITLVVVAILAGIGAPSFMRLIEDNRTTTQTNELVSALNLARSEAIKRGASVTLRNSGSDFTDGWCVHTGGNCSGNDIIRQYPAMNRMNVTASASTIEFNGRGFKSQPANNPVTLTIEPEDCTSGATDRARELEIANTGRVSVSQLDCS